VSLWRAGSNYEAGKSDNTRHGTHSESDKHADDNLSHDIPFSACDLSESPNRSPDLGRTNLDLSKK
jgi:hypothetical protein